MGLTRIGVKQLANLTERQREVLLAHINSKGVPRFRQSVLERLDITRNTLYHRRCEIRKKLCLEPGDREGWLQAAQVLCRVCGVPAH